MIRVSHAVTFPFIFILLCEFGRHGGVLKFNRNGHFLRISNHCGAGRGADHTDHVVKVCCIVACSMLFICFEIEFGRKEC